VDAADGPAWAGTKSPWAAESSSRPTVAQLYVASRLLRRIDKSDHPDLAAAVVANAEALL
jgi:hypothetical protein